jgi:hypothetical protein
LKEESKPTKEFFMAFYEEAEKLAEKCQGKWPSIIKQLVTGDLADQIIDASCACPECKKTNLYIRSKEKHLHALQCRSCGWIARNGLACLSELAGFSGRKLLHSVEEAYQFADTTVDGPGELRQERDWAREELEYITTHAIPVLSPGAEHGLQYLSGRGIDVDNQRVIDALNETTYYLENFKYYHKDKQTKKVTKGNYPILAFKVCNLAGTHIAWQKVYLDKVKPIKAPVPEAKLTTANLVEGQFRDEGYVIPFGRYSGDISTCEGPETGLAIIEMGFNVFACVNKNGMYRFEPPHGCKKLRQFGDYDKTRAGQEVVVKKHVELSLNRPEINVEIWLPPSRLYKEGDKSLDFLDLVDGYKRGKFDVPEFEDNGIIL